jgi:hypothetical protein
MLFSKKLTSSRVLKIEQVPDKHRQLACCLPEKLGAYGTHWNKNQQL